MSHWIRDTGVLSVQMVAETSGKFERLLDQVKPGTLADIIDAALAKLPSTAKDSRKSSGGGGSGGGGSKSSKSAKSRKRGRPAEPRERASARARGGGGPIEPNPMFLPPQPATPEQEAAAALAAGIPYTFGVPQSALADAGYTIDTDGSRWDARSAQAWHNGYRVIRAIEAHRFRAGTLELRVRWQLENPLGGEVDAAPATQCADGAGRDSVGPQAAPSGLGSSSATAQAERDPAGSAAGVPASPPGTGLPGQSSSSSSSSSSSLAAAVACSAAPPAVPSAPAGDNGAAASATAATAGSAADVSAGGTPRLALQPAPSAAPDAASSASQQAEQPVRTLRTQPARAASSPAVAADVPPPLAWVPAILVTDCWLNRKYRLANPGTLLASPDTIAYARGAEPRPAEPDGIDASAEPPHQQRLYEAVVLAKRAWGVGPSGLPAGSAGDAAGAGGATGGSSGAASDACAAAAAAGVGAAPDGALLRAAPLAPFAAVRRSSRRIAVDAINRALADGFTAEGRPKPRRARRSDAGRPRAGRRGKGGRRSVRGGEGGSSDDDDDDDSVFDVPVGTVHPRFATVTPRGMAAAKAAAASARAAGGGKWSNAGSQCESHCIVSRSAWRPSSPALCR